MVAATDITVDITATATRTHGCISPEDRALVGIGDGLVRMSVGIEAAEDILADVKQALGTLS